MSVFDLTLDRAGAAILQDEKARTGRIMQEIWSSAEVGADILKKRAPKDLGNLEHSIYVTKGVRLDSSAMDANNAVHVMVDAPYAGIVDLGARPHTPPIGPLVGWAMRHAHLSSPIGAGNSRSAESTAYAIAKGIQAAIAARGNRPTFFVRNSMPAIVADLHLKIARAMSR